MPTTAQNPRRAAGQSSFDFLLGSPARKSYTVKEAARLLHVSTDSIIALWDKGELWGVEHCCAGKGDRVNRIVHRDSLLLYLVTNCTADEDMRIQRLCEALTTLDHQGLLRVKPYLDHLINETR